MAVLKRGELFPADISTDLWSQVQGHSTLAKLSTQKPIPFNGTTEFVFNLEGNAQIVGEGEKKEAGSAVMTSKVIKPVKIIYQARVSDEFKYGATEKKIQYLTAFVEGYAKKIAEAFDIAAIHGLEPKSLTDASFKATNSFDGLVTDNVVAYTAETVDDNLEDAIQLVIAAGGANTGVALSPLGATALSKVKVNGIAQYPEFKFGQNPGNFAGNSLDVNRTLTIAGEKNHAIVGDFQNRFKWGYAEGMQFEVIEHGDPDQTGRDLKAHNEVCLRAECYVGWGILDETAFARVVEQGE